MKTKEKTMKVLNLYAGIGGNRKLWPDYVEVTAVEYDPEIASIYQKFFPNDTVIVGDATKYLLEHFKEFDFIWASPPCPTHSRIRTLWSGSGKDIPGKISGESFKLPDMTLYSIIVFLKHFYKGKWVVENVISYYEPLIPPQTIHKHYFWANFFIPQVKTSDRQIINVQEEFLEEKMQERGFDLSEYDLSVRRKMKLLNNCVLPHVGLHIFNESQKNTQLTIIDLISKGGSET